eukprot:1394554-Amorphochlora_amoeboformis.AAC.1
MPCFPLYGFPDAMIYEFLRAESFSPRIFQNFRDKGEETRGKENVDAPWKATDCLYSAISRRTCEMR